MDFFEFRTHFDYSKFVLTNFWQILFSSSDHISWLLLFPLCSTFYPWTWWHSSCRSTVRCVPDILSRHDILQACLPSSRSCRSTFAATYSRSSGRRRDDCSYRGGGGCGVFPRICAHSTSPKFKESQIGCHYPHGERQRLVAFAYWHRHENSTTISDQIKAPQKSAFNLTSNLQQRIMHKPVPTEVLYRFRLSSKEREISEDICVNHALIHQPTCSVSELLSKIVPLLFYSVLLEGEISGQWFFLCA